MCIVGPPESPAERREQLMRPCGAGTSLWHAHHGVNRAGPPARLRSRAVEREEKRGSAMAPASAHTSPARPTLAKARKSTVWRVVPRDPRHGILPRGCGGWLTRDDQKPHGTRIPRVPAMAKERVHCVKLPDRRPGSRRRRAFRRRHDEAGQEDDLLAPVVAQLPAGASRAEEGIARPSS